MVSNHVLKTYFRWFESVQILLDPPVRTGWVGPSSVFEQWFAPPLSKVILWNVAYTTIKKEMGKEPSSSVFFFFWPPPFRRRRRFLLIEKLPDFKGISDKNKKKVGPNFGKGSAG